MGDLPAPSSKQKAYLPKEVEEKWRLKWEEGAYFACEPNVPKVPFCMVIPPPNVTGSLHMGHAMYVVQDILARWKRMQGMNVLWLPGVDHAGIATQLVVERFLQKEQGKTRHDIGREAFVQQVWAWKERYGNRINEQLRVLGFSLDWRRQRFTMDPALSKAVTEAFVRLHQEGLVYRAERLINWCCRCNTALSDLEVDFQEKHGEIWHISYPIVDGGPDDKLVVATTRPETLFGDTAVAVHPDDERYRHWIGKRARLPLTDRTIPIVADAQLVSMEFGTGAVKITPAHDFNDFEVGQRHRLDMISIFEKAGVLNDRVPAAFRGLSVTDARQAVVVALAEQALLVGTKPHTLQLGHCQRCATVVEPLLSTQWFVRTKPLAEQAVAAVQEQKTTFFPVGWTDDFHRWMAGIRDWCISRQLWWGHRIPAWYDQADPTQVFVARTEEEAHRLAGRTDLVQDEDVLDTWFSSALWPFSTLGWPEETRELKTFYPNSVMETGHDILFFWVARMMMMGIHFMKKVPFRHVLLHALVVDENGEKMSKVRGNVIDPMHVIRGASMDEVLGLAGKTPTPAEKKEALALFKKAFPAAAAAYPEGFPEQGADALRFFLAVMSAQERTIRLSLPRVEGYRHFLNKLWSAARFFDFYAGSFSADECLERYGENREAYDAALCPMDRWILSRLRRTIQQTDAALQQYQFGVAAQGLYHFFWNDVCDWYIEMAKPRLQRSEDSSDKQRALETLYRVLETAMRLLHPFVPFITEEIWSQLPQPAGAPDSLMIGVYPDADAFLDAPDAEQVVSFLQETISGIRSMKATYQLGSDAAFGIKTASAEKADWIREHAALIAFLTKAPSLDVVVDASIPAGSLVHVLESQTLFLPNAGHFMDVGAQKDRLQKERDKALQEKSTLEQRLANPDFVQKAQPDVIAKSKDRLVALVARLGELDATLQQLARLHGSDGMVSH